MKGILEKYQCFDCELTFLVDKAKVTGKTLMCPWCLTDVEAVAESDPSSNIEDQLDGCLYPL